MLIVCPNCQASYRVTAESLGPAGRTVRCAKCSTAWFADASDDSPDEAATGPQPEFTDDAEAGNVDTTARLAEVMARLRAEEHSAPARVSREETRSSARKAARRRLSPAVMAAGISLAFLGALVLARSEIVRLFPQTARLYAMVGLEVNLRGLAFQTVDASERVEGGVPILLVSGNIENITGGVINVPRLRLAVRNMEGRELYVWTVVPRRNRLVAGDTLPFQAQLASPPAEARDVVVRFLARHDAVAGIR